MCSLDLQYFHRSIFMRSHLAVRRRAMVHRVPVCDCTMVKNPKEC